MQPPENEQPRTHDELTLVVSPEVPAAAAPALPAPADRSRGFLLRHRTSGFALSLVAPALVLGSLWLAHREPRAAPVPAVSAALSGPAADPMTLHLADADRDVGPGDAEPALAQHPPALHR